MFFTVTNKRRLSKEQLQTKLLMNAYIKIKHYPIRASETAIDLYIQQQYNMTLKNMCVSLLLNTTMYEDKEGNLVLLFKDKRHDDIASLITYGNGAIPGSRILQIALNS